MTAHALFSPSAAHRWSSCSASLALSAMLPATTSVYAEEGTQAHELAAQILLGQQWDADSEMLGFVLAYTDAVQRDVREEDTLFVETRVDFGTLLGAEGNFGTVDALILKPDTKTVCVHDLKYGRGVVVDAEDNDQLALYALGAYAMFGGFMDIETVEMSIHQPRRDAVSTWVVPVDVLLARAEKYSAVMKEFQSGVLRFAPSVKACRFCPALATCLGARNKVDSIVKKWKENDL